ncbi:MAG: hypothetical protein HRU40_16990, partial [Saprospiraceae bacterium]|nr:hypothetical protein [Saprospiraceae bacterium]
SSLVKKLISFQLNIRLHWFNIGGKYNLRKKLIGNAIIVKYPKYWTPLDWNNSIRHISKVEFKDEVIFNELKE